MRERFPDGQLYLDLQGFSQSATVITPSVAIHRLLTSLGLHPAGLPADLDAQIALYRTELADRRLVLVLDNARDAAQVRPLLPGSATTAVLITSRRQLTSLAAMEGADQLLLDLLSDEEAMRLLAVRLGQARVADDREAAADIVTRCARLPLALTVAASRAAQRPSPLREIAAELVDHNNARLDFLTAGDAVSEVRSAFSWSYDVLRPPSAELFRLLGLHGTPEFSAPVAAALIGVSVPEVRPLLDELTRASLLTRTADGRFTCHDLLRAYAVDRALHVDTGERQRRAVDRMLRHYLNTAHLADRLLRPRRDPITIAGSPALDPPADAATAMTWFATEQSALLAALRHCQLSKLDTYTWQFAWVLTTFLTRRGPWTELASAWESALLAAERLGDPLMRADAHRHLAQVHTDLRQYGRAIGHFRRAMRLYEAKADAVGAGHSSFGMSLLRERQGRTDAALQHAQRSHHSFATAGHQPGQAVALNAIAWCHAELGHCRSALAHSRRALALFQALGDEHGQADTWDTIGYAHHQSGQHELAARAYQTAVELYRRCGDRYYEAGSLTRLGDAHQAAANTIPARAAWQQALTILVAQAHPRAAQVAAKLRVIDRLDQMRV